MNDFAVIRECKKDNTLYLFVDTSKAVFRGMKWAQLGDYGKRKCENMLFLTKISKGYIKVKYV